MTDEQWNDLEIQYFKANDVATRVVYKTDLIDDVPKHLGTVMDTMKKIIVARGRKVIDVNFSEFSDFYVIKYTLADHKYTYKNRNNKQG